MKNGLDRTAQETGKCGFCHGVHKALGPALWVATKEPAQEFDGGCIECHQSGGMAAEKLPHQLHHPIGPKTADKAAALQCKLPLFDVKGHRAQDGFVACASCHDPHGGQAGSKEMLRQTDNRDGTTLCAQCHQEAISIQNSLHHPDLLREQFEDVRYCGPCHAVHAQSGMTSTDMWGAPLGPNSQAHAIRKCTGCHSSAGGATTIKPTVHPAVAVQNLINPDSPGCLPLFNEQGEVDQQGWIACATCHTPHGPPVSTTQPMDFAELSLDQLRGLRPMVREYQAPNLCTTCHGFDGMRRFLYYHDAEKRTGPLSETKP
jgi:predicted CXXCH cytochrome family protein